ncbi:heavy-metal-associated domain-containing protein [Flavobacterium aestuarii]|uniref:heavy-metal-associated domain-containing protein n=1 Tax=Flavobacterium aestuarii TaxID=3149227 RepID=UPI0032B37011
MKTENNALRFKTNINCEGCVAKVTPFLNSSDIKQWEVDTASRDKILTVQADKTLERHIIQKVQEAGFKIEPTDY